MTAVLGGLAAALAWGISTVTGSYGARRVGATSWLAGVMTVGLIAALPFVAVTSRGHLTAATSVWLAVSGVGNVAGLLLTYQALRGGQVSVVAPLLSTEGAIAALFAVAGGEHISTSALVALTLVAVGVVLVVWVAPDVVEQSAGRRTAVLLAMSAALCFGASLFATGQVSAELSIAWAVLPARLVGVVAVAVPLAAARRWRLTRTTVPWVVLGGACEVVGVAAFAWGARHGVAVSAVLGSQFATVAVIASAVIFRERLAPRQFTGVVSVAVGVAALSALRA